MSLRARTRLNGCLIDPGSAAHRRRSARSALCWQRPLDHERRRRHPANSLYPRIGRT
ncbi:hypothetical protein J4573_53200 [Actinomadura barringtoniae]|uniref:Uncharacterized protein n=1 Tax=Actinomadura barringtoniae TaxID=1427535 RepID=A0A939T7B7_9ACTN|nr:hypothetical protein [Actinomadura barringtoniae]MBO2455916.1 hypothetical protein [Actinomadura barringtoniae]